MRPPPLPHHIEHQPPPGNRLLLTYVLTASLVVHLLGIPLWTLWLGQEGDFDTEPVKLACEQVGGDQIVQRPTRNPLPCESKGETVVVARFEEEEEEEPEPPEELQNVVMTPPDVEETETPEEGHAATIDSKIEEEETVAKGDGRPGGRAQPARRQKQESQPQQQPESGEEDALIAAEARVRDLPEVEQPGGRSGSAGEATEEQQPKEAEIGEISEMMPEFEGDLLAAAAQPGADGTGGTIDYLDVAEGERTLMNRRRVNYADFFERIKVGVANHWQPGRVYRQRDPSGKIYGVGARLTILNVTLRGDGTLAELFVEQPSGLDFLDDEAVRAMKTASPFPNPPEGLKGLDGTVQFRFGFHFEVSSRKFRVFRYR